MWLYNEEGGFITKKWMREKKNSEENFTIFFTIIRRNFLFSKKNVGLRKMNENLLRFYAFLRFFLVFLFHERQKTSEKTKQNNLCSHFFQSHKFSERNRRWKGALTIMVKNIAASNLNVYCILIYSTHVCYISSDTFKRFICYILYL